MEAREPYDAAAVAWRTGLPLPQVRYYAALYGEALGAQPAPLGEWRFRAEHLPFFRALAQGTPPAEALRAVLAGPAPGASPAPPPPPQTPHSSGTPDPGAGPEQPLPRDLGERLDELAWQIQDLLEETRQVQILLSRVIEILAAHSPASRAQRSHPEFRPPPAGQALSPPAGAVSGPRGAGRPGGTAARPAAASRPTGAGPKPAPGGAAADRPSPGAAEDPPAAAPAAAVIREAALSGHDEAVRAWVPRAL